MIGTDFLVDPGRNRTGGMAEDQMFDDLENMLGANPGGKASPMITGLGSKRRGSNSRIVPHNDIDDLEDLNNFSSKRAPAPQSKANIAPASKHSKPPLASGNVVSRHAFNAGL